MCRAVTRVLRAAKTGKSEQEVKKTRTQIKDILQYLAMIWNWCLTIRPHEHVRDLTIVPNASLAPRSHEG
eukprot:7236454-Prorocentrum_lima.AAC.1